MRLLLINPNTTAAVTDRLAAVGRAIADRDTQILALTAPRGFPYVSARSEAQIAGAIALEMIADHAEGADGAIIGAFGDPGLFAARELFDFPVVGMSEAAMLTACMLGARFAIVTFAAALGPWFEDCVASHGLTGRCAAVRALDGGFASLADVQDEKEALLVDLANRAVAQDGADVVILAGAPLAGLAAKVKARVAVPLVDPVAAAVRQVETLVRLAPRKAAAGGFARPPAKPNAGLAEALGRRLARGEASARAAALSR
jgi:Asp/Glu/hydantoin racemase